MKAVFLLAIVLVVAVLVPETEAGFFANLGQSLRRGVESVGKRIKTGASAVGRGIKAGARTVGNGVTSFGRGFMNRTERVDLGRGKRSALALNPDTVSALNTASTFNLGLPVIKKLFSVSDENKNAFLDGQEVLVFLGMIRSLTGVYDQPQEPVIQ